MSDTQWPCFEVFLQETPERPHRHAGSVHAPDAEMALLNARDVFVRRPECCSLWVAPAAAFTRVTAEGLSERRSAAEVGAQQPGAYLVFAKTEARGTLAYLKQVSADSPRRALDEAVREWSEPPAVLWAILDRLVTRSDSEDAAPLFSPARDKPYRDQSYYHTDTALRRLRRGEGE